MLVWNWVVALLVAACCSAAAVELQEQVTVKRGRAEWRFGVAPAHDGKPETLFIHAALNWEAEDGASLFTPEAGTLEYQIPLIGGEYEHEPAGEVMNQSVSNLEPFIANYLEIDLDFAGGTWSQLGDAIRGPILAAYAEQLPPVAKRFLPAAPTIRIPSINPEPRFAALKAKARTLAGLGAALPIAVQVEGGLRPAITNPASKIKLSPEIHSRWYLRPPEIEGYNADAIQFYNLAELPALKGGVAADGTKAAQNLAALFEISWKTEKPVVWARTRFHPETGILIVQGTGSELALADRCFNTLCRKNTSENPFNTLAEKLDALPEKISEAMKPEKPVKDADK